MLPFNFGSQQVRTLLIGEQPWFVAADVSSALEYRIAGDMTRNLDEDEKGTQIVRTPGGDQEMLVINESGLYSAILRSRKTEAKRFKKWVTAEVLPAIRKHGRYEDHGKMTELMNQLSLGQFNAIKGVIRDKAKAVPAELRQSFQLVMHNRLHTRFNVSRTELIPAADFDAACNFIGAYAIEGEYLAKQEEGGLFFSRQEVQHIYLLMSRHAALMFDRTNILDAARALTSASLMRVYDQINEGRGSFGVLDARREEIYQNYRALGLNGGYAMERAA
ncbi:Bro-N domain-containing protein [Pseudomonas monsensis]|nr:Bro-N domain-containing protein [Pseudomonas monsensis]